MECLFTKPKHVEGGSFWIKPPAEASGLSEWVSEQRGRRSHPFSDTMLRDPRRYHLMSDHRKRILRKGDFGLQVDQLFFSNFRRSRSTRNHSSPTSSRRLVRVWWLWWFDLVDWPLRLAIQMHGWLGPVCSSFLQRPGGFWCSMLDMPPWSVWVFVCYLMKEDEEWTKRLKSYLW